MEVTTTQVLNKIANDDRFAVNCLLQLYRCQTEDEQQVGDTREKNGVGFNGCDAGILSSFAEQALEWKKEEHPRWPSPLSQKQMDLLRRKLPTYQKQITRLTNAAIAAKGTAPAVVEAPARNPQMAAAVEVMVQPLHRPVTAEEYANARKFVSIFGTAADVATFDRNNVDIVDTMDDHRRLDGQTARRVEEDWSDAPLPRVVEMRPTHFPEEVALDSYDLTRVPSPSCTIIEDGSSLRFPTEKEVNNWALEQQLRDGAGRKGGRDGLTGYVAANDPFATI